ncbi:hypothetical protein [uncultured Cocleimonas sp.]|uniref:hypothetical protein n=1 Tax=uncultured Cocleimonas sp. TaxID=1051587 RepID=UPI00260372F0|nr:hypothetical protein [uncultured Cocleimonas sp.]
MNILTVFDSFEQFIPTIIFWASFTLSAGPFWITVMSSAKHTPISELFRHFLIYQLLGWFPIIMVIGAIVTTIGKLNEAIYTSLYFIGAAVIFYLAYKTYQSTISSKASFKFNWKAMIVLSWTNPKVWLTVPTGVLTANYTDNNSLNILIMFIVGIPLYYIGFFMWAYMGKFGAKIAKDKFNIFNALLLFIYGAYLLYEGVLAVKAA